MLQDNYDILNDILAELEQELSDLNAQIYRNILYIREAEHQLEFFMGEDSDASQMFSPRSMTDQHKEKIDKLLSFKNDFEERNKGLNHTKEVLEEKIDRLKRILNQEYSNVSVLNIQEEDRQRIAEDLHDTSLQNLTHMIHQIELCSMYIDQDPVKAKLELSLVSKNLKEIVDEIRNTIFDLRPMTFDDLGLKDAFERLIEKVNEQHAYKIVSEIDNVSCETNLTLLHLYRVVQEAFNNIVKHADADKICFFCKVKDSLCVIDINDNGCGFYSEDIMSPDKHFGLAMMKERIELLNGKIDVSSIRGEGTKIHIEVPIK